MDTVCLPIAFVILVIMLRSLRLLIITIFCTATSILTSFMILYPIAKYLVDTVTFAPSVMMSICLALSIDYSLFLLSRFREELIKGTPVGRAIHATTFYAGRIITLSGSILTISFLSNLFMNNNMLRSLGLSSSIASLTNLIVNITAIPSFLFLFPRFFSDFSYCGIGTCLTRFCPSPKTQKRLHTLGIGQFRTKREIILSSSSYERALNHPETIKCNPVADPNKNLWTGWGTHKIKGLNQSTTANEDTSLLVNAQSQPVENYGTTTQSSTSFSDSSEKAEQDPKKTYELALLLEQRKSIWFKLANCTTYWPMSIVVCIIILGCTAPFAYIYMFKMDKSLDNTEILDQGSTTLALFQIIVQDFSPGMIEPINLIVDAREANGTWNNQFFCWSQNMSAVLASKFPELVDVNDIVSPVYAHRNVTFITADAFMQTDDCSEFDEEAGACEAYKLAIHRYASVDYNQSFSFCLNTKVNPLSTEIYNRLPDLYYFAQDYLDKYPTPAMYDEEDSNCKLKPEMLAQYEQEQLEAAAREKQLASEPLYTRPLTNKEILKNPILFRHMLRKQSKAKDTPQTSQNQDFPLLINRTKDRTGTTNLSFPF